MMQQRRTTHSTVAIYADDLMLMADIQE